MRFPEWIDKQPRGTLTRVARDAGVASSTVRLAARGELVRTYRTAKAISEATDGAVTVRELCEAEDET